MTHARLMYGAGLALAMFGAPATAALVVCIITPEAEPPPAIFPALFLLGVVVVVLFYERKP